MITMHVLSQYLQNRISHSRLLIRLVSHNYPSLYFAPVRLAGRVSACDLTRRASLSETHVRTSSIMRRWFVRTFELLTGLDEWNRSWHRASVTPIVKVTLILKWIFSTDILSCIHPRLKICKVSLINYNW